MENYKLIHGDCLVEMQNIPDKSIDMVLCDLPYGATKFEWDKIIPFDKLWEQYKRIVKDNGAIVLFAKNCFSARLILSNERGYKHKWIWNKCQDGSFQNAKFMPLQITEEILVFTNNGEKVNYYPIMRKGKYRKRGGANNTSCLTSGGLTPKYENYSDLYYPTNILTYPSKRKNRLHPTEKPAELLEYLIKTYTKEGETVLDNCMGSGNTGCACVTTNRKFIGIELDDKFFDIAKWHIACAYCQ